MKVVLILLLFFSVQDASCNSLFLEIEGRILAEITESPIPYVKIFNLSNQKGTISNEEGYFRLPITELTDHIRISCMGYLHATIQLKGDQPFYMIYLREENRTLNEVVIEPKDNSYLYRLIAECQKNVPKIRRTAKAYYELKSYFDTAQIELVEGFYNVAIQGYDIDHLDLKAGRLALQNYQDRFFASLESSRAISQLKTVETNSYFPISPLELKKKDLKNSFYLTLESKYLNEDKDSIYQINFSPKNDNGEFYRGKLWINKSEKTLQKINLICDLCKKHPFLPLFPSDSIENVNFNITKTFIEIDGEMVFNYIDFYYVIDYKSRVGLSNESAFQIKTNAVVYAYDFDEKFNILTADLLPENASDYRKFNALPYNSFFWNYNDEYRMNSEADENTKFFSSTASLTNISIFKTLPNKNTGFFEHPFIQWSPNRVLFKEFISDTLPSVNSTGVIYDNYHLKVNFYIDLNQYADSVDIKTAVILNPYESFYHLPIDNVTQCFINIYFDVCEIHRRKLQANLDENSNDVNAIKSIYALRLEKFQKADEAFFKAIDRGTNRPELLKWNAYVKAELDIDNMAVFGIGN